MSSKVAVTLIVVLAVVIVVLAWFLWTTPASAPTISTLSPTSTAPAANAPMIPASTSSAPLDKSVVVTSPTPNETVAQSFTVAGTAPGAWFSEATFPIQVRDNDDNLVGNVGASAQGDWETAGPVTFTAAMNIDPSFHGPANLILLKDNPSGLPQNDDSVTIPIVVQ
jgi:hypothetical protein